MIYGHINLGLCEGRDSWKKHPAREILSRRIKRRPQLGSVKPGGKPYLHPARGSNLPASPTIETAGLVPRRADDLYQPSAIVHDIWDLTERAKGRSFFAEL